MCYPPPHCTQVGEWWSNLSNVKNICCNGFSICFHTRQLICLNWIHVYNDYTEKQCSADDMKCLKYTHFVFCILDFFWTTITDDFAYPCHIWTCCSTLYNLATIFHCYILSRKNPKPTIPHIWEFLLLVCNLEGFLKISKI